MMKLNVKDQEIRLIKHQEEDYICLTEEAGLHAFTLSPQKWISATNAIGVVEFDSGNTYKTADGHGLCKRSRCLSLSRKACRNRSGCKS